MFRKMAKKFDLAGFAKDGTTVFNERGGERVIAAKPHKLGAPLTPGCGYGHLRANPEGGVEIEVHVNPDHTVNKDDTAAFGTGPAKVATVAYRSGWDRVFGGDNSVN